MDEIELINTVITDAGFIITASGNDIICLKGYGCDNKWTDLTVNGTKLIFCFAHPFFVDMADPLCNEKLKIARAACEHCGKSAGPLPYRGLEFQIRCQSCPSVSLRSQT